MVQDRTLGILLSFKWNKRRNGVYFWYGLDSFAYARNDLGVVLRIYV